MDIPIAADINTVTRRYFGKTGIADSFSGLKDWISPAISLGISAMMSIMPVRINFVFAYPNLYWMGM